VANAVADAIGRPSSVKRLPLRPHAVFGLIHGVPEPP
jgi:CO/xanthine dehydrogenase Mo-binding subunit